MFGLPHHAGPAIIDSADGRTLDYDEFVRLARYSVAPMGTEKSLLFQLCDNSLSTVAFYAGALLTGHVTALLDAKARFGLTASVLRSYGPPWIAGPPGTAAGLGEAGIEVRETYSRAEGELIRTGYPDLHALHSDLALMLSTSGSTGSRKFVRLSKKNVESNARAIAEYLALTPDERPITALPLHYTFGLSVLNSHWAAGAPIVLSKLSFMQEGFWDAFQTYACTSLAGVPFSFLMLERIGFRSMDLPSLRTLQQAGGALDRKLQDMYRRHMETQAGRLFIMYGQTEATARISFVPPERLAEKIGSAGKAIPGGRITIATDQGLTTAAGRVGEVVYEGPNVMMGYADGPEDLARGDDLGDILHTGDLGKLDEDGYLFLVGRNKRIAKVYGLRVNLDEIEVRLREYGPAAVIASGETILAYCAFDSDASVEKARIVLSKEFNLNTASLNFQRVPTVPTTSSGKVDYEMLQRWSET